jgi:hypothetical protein
MPTLFAYLCAFLRTRHHLGLEILALRQQVTVLKRKHPRPHLNSVEAPSQACAAELGLRLIVAKRPPQEVLSAPSRPPRS